MKFGICNWWYKVSFLAKYEVFIFNPSVVTALGVFWGWKFSCTFFKTCKTQCYKRIPPENHLVAPAEPQLEEQVVESESDEDMENYQEELVYEESDDEAEYDPKTASPSSSHEESPRCSSADTPGSSYHAAVPGSSYVATPGTSRESNQLETCDKKEKRLLVSKLN